MKNLPCGHPSGKNHLVNGRCGTCKMIEEWKKCLSFNDPRITPLVNKIIKHFESGDLVVDKRGKTLMDWSNK